MRIGTPKTLLGLTLTGLLLVTLPLLIAVGHAVVQLGQLTAQSEQVVSHSATATLENQRISSYLVDMERNGRQFLILRNPDLLALYEEDQAGLEQSLAGLSALPNDAAIAANLAMLRDTSRRVRDGLYGEASETTLDQVLADFREMTTAAREVAQAMRLAINDELAVLQDSTRAAQRALAWQSAALVPGLLVLVIFFIMRVGRPIRQVDHAIRDLGQGRFDRPIHVRGPRDIEALGRQLEWLRERLQESAEEKNRFLRHMSHELKTPLANIREGTELLMDGAVGTLDGQQKEVTSILRDNGMKLQKLIENLLTFSAWQSKTISLDLSDVELRPLVYGILNQHRLVIASRKIQLKIEVSPITIRADDGKLRLVLDNLISNAVKFTPPGGTIDVSAALRDENLIIDVADTGPGVAPEDADRIFEAFYRGKHIQGSAVGGTGIGLSVVDECVQVHGGTVALVRDSDWPGAHFRVVLPVGAALRQRPVLVVNA